MAFVEFCKKEQPPFTKERKKQQQILSGPDNRDVQTLKKALWHHEVYGNSLPSVLSDRQYGRHVLRQHTTIN